MKYLNDYTKEETTRAFNRAGAFFAFSDKQFKEEAKEGIEYRSLGAGLICPKKTAKQLMKDIADVTENGIKQDLKENWAEKIIARELYNHEAFYTGDIADTMSALSGYGFSKEKIVEVYNALAANTNAEIL